MEPTSSGIAQDQAEVPPATPDAPVLVAQVTCVTPVLSLATPLNVITAAVVETDVAPGEVMVNVGGVVSVPVPGLDVGDDDACRVMVTVCETRLDPAEATTVIVFAPIARGMFEIVQAAAVPRAVPEAVASDHVTVIVPEPPCADPVKLTADAVVVAAGGFTVRVSADGAGAGAAELCAAYRV